MCGFRFVLLHVCLGSPISPSVSPPCPCYGCAAHAMGARSSLPSCPLKIATEPTQQQKHASLYRGDGFGAKSGGGGAHEHGSDPLAK